LRYWLRDVLRGSARDRCSKCGRVPIRETITISIRNGRAHYDGLLRCGSVWECPTCSAQINAERSSEVVKAVEWWRGEGGSVLMLTLTGRPRRSSPETEMYYNRHHPRNASIKTANKTAKKTAVLAADMLTNANPSAALEMGLPMLKNVEPHHPGYHRRETKQVRFIRSLPGRNPN